MATQRSPPLGTQRREAVLPEYDLATVTLLTSELVTNAVIHSEQPETATTGLRVIRSQNRLRVEVAESGSGFDPAERRRPDPEGGGLGLVLVGRLSDRWGTTHRTGSQRDRFCVWFELAENPSYSAEFPPPDDHRWDVSGPREERHE